MKNQPPVSIYVITYLNSETRCEVLRETCRWALAQRYPAFEVVVSDNHGPIPAADALKSIDDPRLRVCANAENAGFSGNMNRCLEHCRHDIIKPLCDDDLLHPDYLAQTVPLVDDETLVTVDVEKFLIGKVTEKMTRVLGLPLRHEVRPAGYDRALWSIPYCASAIPSATLFTRKLFRDLGGLDGRLGTPDWDFFVEACLHRKVVHLQEVLCYVGVWAGSLTEEMLAKPFFYPQEMQYVQFRVMRCKGLPPSEQRALRKILFRQFATQSMRPVRHPFSRRYWSGWAGYARRFFTLLRQPLGEFGPRPNRLP